MFQQDRLYLSMVDRIAGKFKTGPVQPNGGGFRLEASDEFQRAYRNAPDAFVKDCILWPGDEGPTAYQLEILGSVPEKRRVAVRGPHGLGKTSMAAWLVIWFALTRDGEDWKCATTAGAWRQLTKYLWPEIHKWTRRLRWDKIQRSNFSRTELLQMSLKLVTGEAFPVASNQHDLIEGAHADSLMYIFDESKAIPSDTFDAAEGAFSGAGQKAESSETSEGKPLSLAPKGASEAFAIAISTPGEPSGRFYDIHARKPGYEDWWVRHVTLEEAIKAGRISRVWAEQRKRQWGEKSALYQNRVEGEFCASDEDGVVPLAWIELANQRWLEWRDAGKNTYQFTCVGVDPARSGEAKTAMALRFESVIDDLRRTSKEDTMATTGRVKGILDKQLQGYAVVDIIGIGAGVVDRLREQEMDVVAFNAGEATRARDRSGELGFTNKRSAAWWNFREMLDPDSGEDIALPPDDLLTGDLTAPHWRTISGGKIEIESKHDGWMDKEGNKRPSIVQRLGRSTDDGDAVVMAFFPRDWMDRGGAPLVVV